MASSRPNASQLHVALLLAAAAAACVLCAAPWVRWADDVAWAWHPALGSAAFVLMSVGTVAYALEAPAAALRAAAPDRARRRVVHGALQAAAAAALVGAWAVGVTLRELRGKRHTPWGHGSWAKAAHFAAGHAAAAAVVLVSAAGAYKLWRRRTDGARVLPVHGIAGVATWGLCVVCVGTAVWFSYWQKGYGGTAVGGGAAAAVLAVLTWVVWRGPRPPLPETAPTAGSDERSLPPRGASDSDASGDGSGAAVPAAAAQAAVAAAPGAANAAAATAAEERGTLLPGTKPASASATGGSASGGGAALRGGRR